MNVQQAYTLAVNLLDKHGLRAKGWVIDIDNAKRRFGCCNYTKKEISLSRPLIEANEHPQVLDTILHEIAHALTPGHHHDEVWKAKCREIGCKDERCYSDKDTVLIAGKYKAVCGGCGKTHNRHKRPSKGRRFACLWQNHIKDWSKKKILEYKVAR
jgi:predicted SprT family Zn-dependent metalloprotease